MAITIENWIAADKRNFRLRESRIRSALTDLDTGMLDGITDENKEDVFYMLCFCLIVPQSKQVKAEMAIEDLKNRKFYSSCLSRDEICEILRGKVRYHNNKTDYLINARTLFYDSEFWSALKNRYRRYKDGEDILGSTRTWLVKTVKGMGMKLASHFLRNCGMRGLAILDVHVLRAMKKRGLITEESPLTKSRYISIEKQTMNYAERLGLDLDELDQLFWSSATGYVGK